MKNIILIAPPSAGKGTHAKTISELYHIPHISTGQLLREVAKEETEMGEYVQESLSNGELIKDEFVYQMLEDRLMKSDCEHGYILDGFPRKLEQAIEYDEILKRIHKDLGIVLLIDVDKNILISRVTGRRICEDCGQIYNINTEESKPKQESVCDNCSGRLIQRSDDNLEAFEYRYQTYLSKTLPLIDYYTKKGVLYHVDGNKEKDEVFHQIKAIITGKNEE